MIFETDSAAKTALLLTNALIVDRPITVVPHVPSSETDAQVEQTTEAQADITNREFTAPDHERVCTHSIVVHRYNTSCTIYLFYSQSKTSVIASLLAAGYILGDNTATQAREFDGNASSLFLLIFSHS